MSVRDPSRVDTGLSANLGRGMRWQKGADNEFSINCFGKSSILNVSVAPDGHSAGAASSVVSSPPEFVKLVVEKQRESAGALNLSCTEYWSASHYSGNFVTHTSGIADSSLSTRVDNVDHLTKKTSFGRPVGIVLTAAGVTTALIGVGVGLFGRQDGPPPGCIAGCEGHNDRPTGWRIAIAGGGATLLGLLLAVTNLHTERIVRADDP